MLISLCIRSNISDKTNQNENVNNIFKKTLYDPLKPYLVCEFLLVDIPCLPELPRLAASLTRPRYGANYNIRLPALD